MNGLIKIHAESLNTMHSIIGDIDEKVWTVYTLGNSVLLKRYNATSTEYYLEFKGNTIIVSCIGVTGKVIGRDSIYAGQATPEKLTEMMKEIWGNNVSIPILTNKRK